MKPNSKEEARQNRFHTLLAASNAIMFVESQASDLRLHDGLRMAYAKLAKHLKAVFKKEEEKKPWKFPHLST